jgi:hypothetical protein
MADQPLQPTPPTLNSVIEPTPPEPTPPEPATDAPPEVEMVAAAPAEMTPDEPESESEEIVDDPADFLTWEASEYVHHEKGMAWYVILAVFMAVLLIVAFIFKLWLSIGVFVAMGAAIAVYAHKPPRVLAYQLDTTGITIDGKLYPYESFRSFGVLSDVEWHAMDLEPAQRFMPRLTVLFGDDDFDDIVAHPERHLPRADRDPDLIERLTRYLRF